MTDPTPRHTPPRVEATMTIGMLAERAGVADSAPTDATGSTWRHLQLLEQVGEGSYGALYRAWDPLLDREVALKLYRHHVRDDGDAVIEEARMLARIRHPNVVGVHGAERVDGRVGIWMDFIHGHALSRTLEEQGPFSAADAAAIGRDVCRALAAVHQAGLLHRDVKASNVMREPNGRVVLVDFGTGSERVAHPGTQSLAGTPLYLAPELIAGEAQATVRAEIYAVGVLLFRLVTDTYPVAGVALADARAAHQSGQRRRLRDLRPDLPPPFVDTVERAIATVPEARFATAGALERALVDLASPDTAEHGANQGAGGTSALRHLARWWRPTTAALAALAALWIMTTPPRFDARFPEITAFEHSGPGGLANWLYGYSTGQGESNDGRFTFEVTNDFPDLFLTQPSVTPNGTLAFATQSNGVGKATVSVRLIDHQRLFGIGSTSAHFLFPFTIAPLPHPPVVVADRFEGVAGVPLRVGAGPPPAGLVHWWRAENNARDDLDGVDGMLRNGVGFAEGRSGRGFRFDGLDDAVSFTGAVGAFGTSDFTASFLIRVDPESARSGSVLGHQGCGVSPGFVDVSLPSLSRSPTGRVRSVLAGDAGPSGELTTLRRVDDGAFHSVALTRQGLVTTLLVDGAPDVVLTASAAVSLAGTRAFTLGGTACGAPFTGVLDEVAIFDRALTSADIYRLHHHGVLANDRNAVNDLMTTHLVTSPAHGALTLHPDGTFEYTPNAGFIGEDQFTYRARNAGEDTSGVGTVTIVIVPARR